MRLRMRQNMPSTMRGTYAGMAYEDFGRMNGLWDSFTNLVSDTLDKTTTQLTTQLQTEAAKAVTNLVLKTVGIDGSTKSVSMTPEQAKYYEQTGQVPPGVVLPPGYMPLPPQKTFMDQYGTAIMIAGGLTLATILGLVIYKAVKK